MDKEEYREYLNSEEWQQLRDIVKKSRGHDCEYCGDPATEVHHKSYKSWETPAGKHVDVEDISNFLVLCHSCHGLLKKENLGSKCLYPSSYEPAYKNYRGYWQKGEYTESRYCWDTSIDFNSGRCGSCGVVCQEQDYEMQDDLRTKIHALKIGK